MATIGKIIIHSIPTNIWWLPNLVCWNHELVSIIEKMKVKPNLIFGISSTIRIGIGKNYEFILRPKALNFINM
jgi:hypothetical protein